MLILLLPRYLTRDLFFFGKIENALSSEHCFPTLFCQRSVDTADSVSLGGCVSTERSSPSLSHLRGDVFFIENIEILAKLHLFA